MLRRPRQGPLHPLDPIKAKNNAIMQLDSLGILVPTGSRNLNGWCRRFTAVAAAATLGVTEPYSAGIGGGGYFLFYSAKTGRVGTIDGRETAPAAMPFDAFIDPATGRPYRFTPELVTSGGSVGAPARRPPGSGHWSVGVL